MNVPALALAVVGLAGAALGAQVHLRWVIAVSLALVVVSFWLSLGPSIQFRGEALPLPALYRWLYEWVPGYGEPSRSGAFCRRVSDLPGNAGRWGRRNARAPLASRCESGSGSLGRPLGRLDQAVSLAAQSANSLCRARDAPALPDAVTNRPGDLSHRQHARAGRDSRGIPVRRSGGRRALHVSFAAGHRRRLLNGYSGVFPPSFVERQRVLVRPTLDPPAAARVIRPATHAVVHRAAWPDNSGQLIGAWLGVWCPRDRRARRRGALRAAGEEEMAGGRALGVGRWAQGALGKIPYAALCPMPYALCPVLPMPYALCPSSLREDLDDDAAVLHERPSRVLLSVAGLSSP